MEVVLTCGPASLPFPELRLRLGEGGEARVVRAAGPGPGPATQDNTAAFDCKVSRDRRQLLSTDGDFYRCVDRVWGNKREMFTRRHSYYMANQL